jgi:hypothetical protein
VSTSWATALERQRLLTARRQRRALSGTATGHLRSSWLPTPPGRQTPAHRGWVPNPRHTVRRYYFDVFINQEETDRSDNAGVAARVAQFESPLSFGSPMGFSFYLAAGRDGATVWPGCLPEALVVSWLTGPCRRNLAAMNTFAVIGLAGVMNSLVGGGLARRSCSACR